MAPALFRGLFKLIRFVLNFGEPTKEMRIVDEVCPQLEVLRLDFSNTDKAPIACIYLADPHKLPRPAKDTNNNTRRESIASDRISLHYSRNEKTDERNQPSDLYYQVDDMSISSDSDFEETLQNHFQYTPKSGTDENVVNGDSPTVFASSVKQQNVNDTVSMPVTFTTSLIPNSTFSREENPIRRNVVEKLNSSNGKNPSSKGRKRRITLINNHFDECSPVAQFCSKSVVASTPLCRKPGGRSNTASKGKACELRQRTFLNLSGGRIDSVNNASFKEEAMKREQGAIAKHIYRIRTSNSKLGSSKEVLPSLNNTRYYSMSTSFDSSGSTSFG